MRIALPRPRAARGAAATLLAGAIAAGAPAVCLAAVVPGSGIGGVKLGQTQAQVRRQLGAPHQLYCWSGAGASCRWQEANYVRGPVRQILFSTSGRVIDLLTTSAHQRARAGIAVGSHQSALRHTYPAAACASQECVLVAPRGHSAVVTTFFTNGTRVSAIEISRADTISLRMAPGTTSSVATITVSDAAGDPELGAIPELTVTAGPEARVGAITPLGGVQSGRYSVSITTSSHHGPVTITATFHWGPPALHRVLRVSASTVLRQL